MQDAATTRTEPGHAGQSLIDRLFRAHPASVDETYFEHMAFAAKFSGALLAAGLAAMVHAVLPFLFEKTAGNIVRRLNARISNRSAG